MARKIGYIAAGAFCFLLLYGCGEAGRSSGKTKGYFDLEALVSQQITLLEAQRPEVEKRLRLNGAEEVLVTSEVDWKDDLAFFLQADISNPSMADSYVVERPDNNTEVYRLKPEEPLPVRRLVVSYEPVTGEVREVTVESAMESLLFDTVKKLRLVLNGEKDHNRILSYEITGFQQLKLGEKKQFEITGLVK